MSKYYLYCSGHPIRMYKKYFTSTQCMSNKFVNIPTSKTTDDETLKVKDAESMHRNQLLNKIRVSREEERAIKKSLLNHFQE